MIRALLPSCPTSTYTHGLPPCHVRPELAFVF